MTKVGVLYPSAKHGFNQEIVKAFLQLAKFTDIETRVITAYKSAFNIGRLIKGALSSSASFVNRDISKNTEESDVIYQPENGIRNSAFLEPVSKAPVFVTTDFKDADYIKDLFGSVSSRQKEADQLAKRLDKAALLHFYNESDRQRFLGYQPDFEKRSVTIPYFLPELSLISNTVKAKLSEAHIPHVLFVENNSCKDGLQCFIDALNILGAKYLKTHNIHITFISKSKPQAIPGVQTTWYSNKTEQAKVLQIMQEASVCVLAPGYRSANVTLIKAMMCNCAIIANQDEHQSEILNSCGILVPFRAPYKIAKALQNLVDDSLQASILGNRAAMRAQAMYQPSVVAAQYKNCFDQLLSHNGQH